MGFLKSIFGINSSSHEKLELKDEQLGTFSALNNDGNRIIWKGTATFLGQPVSLFISGDQQHLDDSKKTAIRDILNNETNIEPEIDRVLKEQYENGDKEYVHWKTHFTCISVSATANDVTITMEEKDSYYNFNIQFSGNKAIDVAIDS